MTENSATIKVVAKQTREYNRLLSEHNVLLKIHVKTVNDFADSEVKCYELRKQNKDLRKMLMRWEEENKILQESLDGAQREIERLIER